MTSTRTQGWTALRASTRWLIEANESLGPVTVPILFLGLWGSLVMLLEAPRGDARFSLGPILLMGVCGVLLRPARRRAQVVPLTVYGVSVVALLLADLLRLDLLSVRGWLSEGASAMGVGIMLGLWLAWDAFLAAFIVIAVLFVVRASTRAAQSRRGSVAHKSLARSSVAAALGIAPYVGGFLAIQFCGSGAGSFTDGSLFLARPPNANAYVTWACGLLLLGTVLLSVADALALVRTVRLSRCTCDDSKFVDVKAASVLDLGIGDDMRYGSTESSSYRERPTAVHGSTQRVMHALEVSLLIDGGAAIAIGWFLVWRLM
jgi:hypothetical protein